MRDIYVIGAYTTAFRKHPGVSFGDLAREAYLVGAEITLAENGGGVIGMEEAAASVVILRRG